MAGTLRIIRERDPCIAHASTVVVRGQGVLIFGASGVGKSDLALRLIDRGATLVADDCTIVDVAGDNLVASAVPHLQGKLEVRGVGIIDLPFVETIALKLAVELGMAGMTGVDILGVKLPCVRIPPHELLAPLIVERLLSGSLGPSAGSQASEL